eukprot:scaffold64978_cov18-Tisochrysis_lutea.AAC.1
MATTYKEHALALQGANIGLAFEQTQTFKFGSSICLIKACVSSPLAPDCCKILCVYVCVRACVRAGAHMHSAHTKRS